MSRLRGFKEIVTVLGVPLSALVGKEGEEYLGALSLPPSLRLGLVFLLILAVYLGIRRSASWLLRSSWLRRILVGAQFVEGTWMDAVRQRGEVVYVGVLRFSVENEQLRVTGENFTPDGVLENSFNSEMVSIDWPVVSFTYSADRKVTGNPESQGFSRIRFSERDGAPARYKGFYQDTSGRRGDYTGWRIIDKEELARIDHPNAVSEVVERVAERQQQLDGKSIELAQPEAREVETGA